MSSASTSTANRSTADVEFLKPKTRSVLDTLSTESSRDIRWKHEISSDEIKQIGSKFQNVEKAISEAFKLFRSAKSLFRSLRDFQTSRDLNNSSISNGSWRDVSKAITQHLNQYKEHIERTLIPALAPLRREYMGHTFTKTKETPKSLLLIAVPTKKVSTVISFNTLKKAVSSSCHGKAGVRCGALGDARIVMSRTQDDKTQRVELVYRTPHKVDLYVNGKRRGSLWNDDAAKLAKRIAEGKPVKFKKDQRYTEYTVV